MQAKCKGAIIGWICGLITATIIWFSRDINLNTVGLIFDVLGALSIVSYPILKGKLETSLNKFLTCLFEEGDAYGKFEKYSVIVGVVLIIIGFIIKIYAN